MSLEIFSFGYWGWGNHVDKLKQLVDYSEKINGFSPPFFVDIRIRRTVRAVGFCGDNFKDVIGSKRYRWEKELGNKSILTRKNYIEIQNPQAVHDLLELALEKTKLKQRVIYFCACEIPSECHRNSVTRFLINHARKQNKKIIVSEWPGNSFQKNQLKINVDLLTFKSIKAGKKSIKASNFITPKCIIPWGTKAIIKCDYSDDILEVYLGYAHYQKDGWYWQVLYNSDNSLVKSKNINKFLKDYGYIVQKSY